jgi:hypothetical protein
MLCFHLIVRSGRQKSMPRLHGRTGVYIPSRGDATLGYLPIPSCTRLAPDYIASARERLDLISSIKGKCRTLITITFLILSSNRKFPNDLAYDLTAPKVRGEGVYVSCSLLLPWTICHDGCSKNNLTAAWLLFCLLPPPTMNTNNSSYIP